MQEQNPSPAQMYEYSFVPAIFAPWTEVLLDRARPRTSESVLDLACGTGIVARTVAPRVGEKGRVVGVDVSDDMLGVAREMAHRERLAIEWHQADAAELPLTDSSVDLLICQQGIQFFSDSKGATAEMHRVLAEGGRAVVSVWQGLECHPVYEALLDAEAHFLGAELAEVATPFMYGSEERLQGDLEDAGFERIEIDTKVHDVRFVDPGRFVTLTLLAGAAVVPDFAVSDEDERSNLVEAVSERAEATLRKFRSADHITFPMHANVAVAYR